MQYTENDEVIIVKITIYDKIYSQSQLIHFIQSETEIIFALGEEASRYFR